MNSTSTLPCCRIVCCCFRNGTNNAKKQALGCNRSQRRIEKTEMQRCFGKELAEPSRTDVICDENFSKKRTALTLTQRLSQLRNERAAAVEEEVQAAAVQS